jgi:serine/threonine protein kinase
MQEGADRARLAGGFRRLLAWFVQPSRPEVCGRLARQCPTAPTCGQQFLFAPAAARALLPALARRNFAQHCPRCRRVFEVCVPEHVWSRYDGEESKTSKMPSHAGPPRACAPPPAEAPDAEALPAGTRLGAYVVTSVIAQGGAATVYAGLGEGHHVAIKVLRRLHANNTQVRHRFAREAELSARVRHPNVVALLDQGEHDGLPYLVMELVAGRSLRQRLWEERPVERDEAFVAFVQLCEALARVHGKGVVHRDLKPENVLVSGTGKHVQLKLIDFGIAKQLEDPRRLPVLTAAGFVLGSPGYMAPEQLEGGRVDTRADIYSLGLLMYEVFTDDWPWEQRHGKILQLQAHQPAQPSPRLKRCAALERLVMQCLERDVWLRPQKVEEVRRGLEAARTAWPLPYVGHPDIFRKLRM